MKHLSVLPALLATIVAFGLAFAQENPIQFRIESYIVSIVTTDDGATQERFERSDTARPGQVIEYRIVVTNRGQTTLPAGSVVITGPVPEGTAYIEDSASPTTEQRLKEYTADGGRTFAERPQVENGTGFVPADEYDAVRWTLLEPMEPQEETTFVYRVIVE